MAAVKTAWVPKMLLLHMVMCRWWGSTNNRKALQAQKGEAENTRALHPAVMTPATFQIIHAVTKDSISSKMYFQA